MDARYYKRIILYALVAFWCVVIFEFSSQSADESSRTSGGIIEAFCNFIVPSFKSFSGTERAEFIESLQFYVRKSAHFTAYGILGFLSFFALFDFKAKLRFLLTVGFSFIYACSDEIHQIFVDGRSCEVRDVFIDLAGATLGGLIALGFTMIAIQIKKKNNKNPEA